MSFKFNSDKEQIRANAPKVIGDTEVSIRSGTGTDEKEVLRALIEPTTKYLVLVSIGQETELTLS